MPFETLYIPEPNSGCWIWIGATWGGGKKYGSIHYQAKTYSAHVFSYLIHKGKIPNGLIVRHTCDVTFCVNPEHLILGTHQDNADDRQARGRTVVMRGEKNGFAKLTPEKVLAIRADPRSQKKIAVDYGVCQMTVCYIKSKKLWGHL